MTSLILFQFKKTVMNLHLKRIKIGFLSGLLILSMGMFSCGPERTREMNQTAPPPTADQDAAEADSLIDNDNRSDNDGNDGTLNGSMPETSTPSPDPAP